MESSNKTEQTSKTNDFKTFANDAKEIHITGKLDEEDKSFDLCQKHPEAQAMETPKELSKLLENKHRYDEFNVIS